jgi:CelD/BcsL family acetyltransferase involved in cellulose biosynthesis
MVDNKYDNLPALSSLWPKIIEKLPPCDVLCIDKIPQTPLFNGLELSSLAGLEQMSTSAHPMTLTPGNDNPAKPAMRAKVLADLRRRKRRLEEQGALRFNICQTPEEAATAFEEMAALRIHRFETIGRRDGLREQKRYSFYRTLCQRYPQFAIVTSLTLDDQPIALQYGLRGPGRYYQLITAFKDGPWRVNAPGRLLMLETLEWCAQQGIEIFDFTIGNETYKKAFGTRELPLMELEQALSWKGRIYLAGKKFQQGIDRALKPLLNK